MKRRILITVIAACAIGVGGSVAYAVTVVHEKQPEPRQSAISVDEAADFVADTAEGSDAGPLDVPVYREDDLIKDNDSCFALGVDSGCRRELSLRFDSLKRLETIFPSEAIRRVGDGGTVYVMYDTEADGRLFIFFSEEKDGFAYADGFPILMKCRLSYDEFKGLAVGDGINRVEEIDSVMSTYRQRFDSLNDIAIANWTEVGIPPTSVHVLTDGIVKIEYRRDSAEGYVITNIVYDEAFVLEGFGGKTCYKIENVDYVD
jgi:hypothetical protein